MCKMWCRQFITHIILAAVEGQWHLGALMGFLKRVFTQLNISVTSAMTEYTQVGQWMWKVQLEYPLHPISKAPFVTDQIFVTNFYSTKFSEEFLLDLSNCMKLQ